MRKKKKGGKRYIVQVTVLCIEFGKAQSLVVIFWCSYSAMQHAYNVVSLYCLHQQKNSWKLVPAKLLMASLDIQFRLFKCRVRDSDGYNTVVAQFCVWKLARVWCSIVYCWTDSNCHLRSFQSGSFTMSAIAKAFEHIFLSQMEPMACHTGAKQLTHNMYHVQIPSLSPQKLCEITHTHKKY